MKPLIRGEPLPWQKESTGEEETAEMRELGPLVPMENVLVNVADSKGRRFCKTSLTLEVIDDGQIAEAQARMPVLRGTVIDILASKNLDELVAANARDSLRTEILDALNRQVSGNGFQDLFFTEYLIQ